MVAVSCCPIADSSFDNYYLLLDIRYQKRKSQIAIHNTAATEHSTSNKYSASIIVAVYNSFQNLLVSTSVCHIRYIDNHFELHFVRLEYVAVLLAQVYTNNVGFVACITHVSYHLKHTMSCHLNKTVDIIRRDVFCEM